MTIAQVRAAWGPARARTLETQPRGSREIELQYDFAAYTVRLVGRPKRERVVSVATTLGGQKRTKGSAWARSSSASGVNSGASSTAIVYR